MWFQYISGMFVSLSCVVCGEVGASLCGGCRVGCSAAPDIDWVDAMDVRALLLYDNVSRPIVLALKNANVRSLAAYVGPAMALLVADKDLEVVTWAPTTSARRRHRGYDQAELLARSVGNALDLPVLRLLRREKGLPQHGQPRQDRLSLANGPGFTARSRARTVTEGAAILVVDDVVTTGGTLASAGATLRMAEANEVVGLALAASTASSAAGPKGTEAQESGLAGRR